MKNGYFFLLFLVLIITPQLLYSEVFVVTNTLESGAGSFRQAVTDANLHAGPDEIVFQIPKTDPGYDETAGVWIITPFEKNLGVTDDELIIDGRTQAQFIGEETNPDGPEICVNGAEAGLIAGLELSSANNTIWHLAIYNFQYSQIRVSGHHNQIYGCHIGYDIANGRPSQFRTEGLELSNAHYNIIGGLSEDVANVISGNGQAAVLLTYSHYNRIQGNLIGLLPAGQDTLGNDMGIWLNGSVGNVIGPGNIIAANRGDGISCTVHSDSTTIIGNILGTDMGTEKNYANQDDGIEIRSSDHINIGGLDSDESNIICYNKGDGINISDSRHVRIYNNFIGTNRVTEIAMPNARGVALIDADSVFIGGESTGMGNIISGNLVSGIYMQNAETRNNLIAGNHIGIGLDETHILPNGEHGIYIHNKAGHNRIGPDNVIAYNQMNGVYLSTSETLGNTITENSIFRNGAKGIKQQFWSGEPPNIPSITDIDPVHGISPANSQVEIFSGPDDEGKIYHASVTADAQGHFTWPGSTEGIMITATATDAEGTTSEFSRPYSLQNLTVTHTGDEGNGSLRWAIEKANEQAGPDTILFGLSDSDVGFNGRVWTISPRTLLPVLTDSGTVIDGRSQTDFAGDTNVHGPEVMLRGSGLVNGRYGLKIESTRNTVSGLIISGFQRYGLYLFSEKAGYNLIFGNYIGTTPDGSDTLSNHIGIFSEGSSHNVFGGSSESQRNLISGNGDKGISIYNGGNNIVEGNFIGTDKNGEKALPNQSGVYISSSDQNMIGGDMPGTANLISGNLFNGITLLQESEENHIERNYIGTTVDGNHPLANGRSGISITGDAHHNFIINNLVSGNVYAAVNIRTDYNTVQLNRIGTDISGTKRLSNQSHGIIIWKANHNQIGPDNLISGNKNSGVVISHGDSNRVQSNMIGLNAAGSDSLPNRHFGIRLEYGTFHNIIGGENKSSGNVISGNGYSGVAIENDSTRNNLVMNNIIGADLTGMTAVPNLSYGVQVSATHNRIERNLISGNKNNGITLFKGSAQNVIIKNRIGLKADGNSALGNENSGIMVYAAEGDTIGPDNMIWYNLNYGIHLNDAEAGNITMTQNSIALNGLKAIRLLENANNAIPAPVLTQSPPLTGTAPPNSRVEVFTDSLGQALVYESSVWADANGNWSYDGPLTYSRATATATDAAGNTSELSAPLKVSVKKEQDAALPQQFFLHQNYPNPFNPKTLIQFGVARKGRITLKVYNILGHHVTTLTDARYEPGQYALSFDAAHLPSGVYFYELQAAGFKAVKKMILLE
jgi:parallel beta-helix repeat protein